MSRAHWVALAVTAGVGGKTITRLLERFGSLEEAFAASPDRLVEVPHVGPHTARAIAGVDLATIETEVADFERQGIQIITWEDSGYPPNLLRVPDAPPVLFLRGTLSLRDARAAAIVGTRTPHPTSADLAQCIGYELATRGWTVVSGLALGIDAAAHRGALKAGGRTLAVLGSGVDAVYPRRHKGLANEIVRCGALLSEVHPQVAVSRQGLIARNRITSGLSRAVIVVQSSMDSGSANTARRALAQGRAVFAITGDGAGDNDLVGQGAVALPASAIDWDDLSARLDQATIQPPGVRTSQPRLF